MPFALIHGEALVACAAWALGEAGVMVVDLGTEWAGVVDSGETFVLHDPLCPMTPPAFLAACVEHAEDRATVVVGVRPISGPVNEADAALTQEYAGRRVDRGGRLQVVSPVVLPAGVVRALDELPSTDFAVLVAALAERFPVETLIAPASASRVTDVADLPALEAATRAAP